MTPEIETLFEKNISLLAVSLDKALEHALKEYEQLRQKEQKGKLSFIYVSFLSSSVLCRLPWLRIDLYDENDRSDPIECFALWDVPCISNCLYRDVNALAERGDRMRDYQLEQAWLNESHAYQEGFAQYLYAIISQCPIAQELVCRWNFGQYLGDFVVVKDRNSNEMMP